MTVWITMVMLGVVLLAAAATDVRTHKVPNALTYPAIVLGVAWSTLAGLMVGGGAGAAAGLEQSVIAFCAGFIPTAMVFAAGGLGGGDVKLMGAVGAISASWQVVLSTAVYALVLGAVMAIVVMIHRGIARQTAARLASAAMQAAAGSRPEIPTDSPRIPFALAIAAGGLLAAAEVLLGVRTPWAAF